MYLMKRHSIHYAILILALAGGAAVIGLLFLRFEPVKAVPISIAQQYNRTLTSGPLVIPVSVADTPATREQGLSGTTILPASAGKLFVFDTAGKPGFWMKDMQYGLDLVWIDSSLKIVSVTRDVSPDTYPQVFYPPQLVQYVLEVNAGFSTRNNLMVGEQFIFN